MSPAPCPLAVVIPSRGRPGSVARTAEAFTATGATGLPVVYALDEDDPCAGEYQKAIGREFGPDGSALLMPGRGMAAAVDRAGLHVAASGAAPFALAVLNDDHLPRTAGWAVMFADTLAEMGTGIVYGNDLLQGERLPTAWAMTCDIPAVLGRVVPAPVVHLYTDDAILDLGTATGCIRYLPEVVIEHMHPLAGKAPRDAGYARVNSRERHREDKIAYNQWLAGGERLAQLAAVRNLRAAAAGRA